VGKILVHEFTTVDGVIDTPTFTAGYPFSPELGDAIGSMVRTCSAILLGRRTYEMFAPAWSGRTAEDDPGAPFFNDSPKYVVSGTLERADWSNSEIVGPYSREAIQALKERVDGNLYVSGSGTLVRALLADGLVDELNLFVYPVTLGAGRRLFAEGDPAAKFSLAAADSFDGGVVHLGYRVSG
jgi:dihydrofolate reductase